MGRPSALQTESRSIFISTRLAPTEHREILKAIRESGQKKSDWLREALLTKAHKAT